MNCRMMTASCRKKTAVTVVQSKGGENGIGSRYVYKRGGKKLRLT